MRYATVIMLITCIDDLFLQMQRTSEARKLYMPFYRLYTPADIVERAEFTNNYTSYTATSITFGTGSTSTYLRRLFRLPLMSGGILSSDANIVVKITVGLDNDIRSGDSDPKFLISDGEYGVGFEFREEDSMHCRGVQGMMGDFIDKFSRQNGVTYSASTLLPEEFVVTLAPSRKWGSCFSSIANGLLSSATYDQDINLNERLWLEVYGEDINEQYEFNYIIVEIHENEN